MLLRNFIPLLVATTCMSCAPPASHTSNEIDPAEQPSAAWHLEYAEALGDGGTILVVLQSVDGERVSADIRSPWRDPNQRLHLHLEPFDFRRLPPSSPVPIGGAEEERFAGRLGQALADELQPEIATARRKRYEFADEMFDLVIQCQDASSIEDKRRAEQELSLMKDSFMQNFPTDRDGHVRAASAVLITLERRQLPGGRGQ